MSIESQKNFNRSSQSAEQFSEDTSVERIVGTEDEAEQLRLVEAHLAEVKRAHGEKFQNEREKTQEELAMISVAAKNVNCLREIYGLPLRLLTPDRVKILNTNHITTDNSGHEGKLEMTLVAGNIPLSQIEIITESAGEQLERFSVIQHELIHAGGYQSLQTDENSGLLSYRAGLETQSRHPNDSGKYTSFLAPLNEAVTEENTRRILASISVNDPELGHLAKKRENDYNTLLELHDKYPDSIVDPSFLQSTLLDVNFSGTDLSIKYSNRYSEERQAMWSLFDKIYDNNQASFSNKDREEAKEEMFQMCTKAAFTGNLLPFGRLMNNTFGNGTFRDYGHLQSSGEIQSMISRL